MFKEELKKIVVEERKKGTQDFLIKNVIKEYLQFPVLNFIYNNKKYKNLIFTGGSCLRICFDLPRVSEYLDFDLKKMTGKNLRLRNWPVIFRNILKKIFYLTFRLRHKEVEEFI